MSWFPTHGLRQPLPNHSRRRRPRSAQLTVTELEPRTVPTLTPNLINHSILVQTTPRAEAVSAVQQRQVPARNAVPVQAAQLLQPVTDNAVLDALHQYGIGRELAADCVTPGDPTGSTLTVTAQDVGDAVANQGFTATVGVGNDSDPNVTSADLTATIDWGDGAVDTGVPVQGPDGNGDFGIDGTHTYGSDGQYAITVTVDDTLNGTEAVATSTATVAPQAALTVTAQDVTATAGQQFTQTVAVVNDTDPNVTADNLAASIDWGDGQVDQGVSLQGPDGNGNFTVDGTHTYGSDGQYTIAVTVDDTANGLESADSATATVAPQAVLTVTGQDVTATAGQPFTQTVAVVSDPGADPSALSASIDWGDGQVDQGVPLQGPDDNGNFSVDGTHTYDNAGHYDVTVTVDDANSGAEAANTAGADVAAANNLTVTCPPIAVTAGSPAEVPVAVVSDPGAASGQLSSTIDWGDGQVDSGVPAQGPDNNSTFVVRTTHPYSNSGQYPVHVTVTDTQTGAQAQGDTTAVVQPAVVGPLSVTADDLTPTAGQPFTGTVAVAHEPGGSAGNLTATIDWGDGQVDPNVPLSQNAAGDFVVSGSHTYAATDGYRITVTVNDTSNGTQAVATAVASVQAGPSGPPIAVPLVQPAAGAVLVQQPAPLPAPTLPPQQPLPGKHHNLPHQRQVHHRPPHHHHG
jgi:hypothetical protein